MLKRIALFVCTLATAVASMVFMPLASALAADSVISAGPVFDLVQPYIEAGVSAAVLTGLTWLGIVFRNWTGLQIEARHREALHSAVMTGVSKALTATGDKLDNITVGSRSAIVADAVDWVTKSTPDAVRYFGLTPDKLQTLALAKLGQILAGAVSK